MNLYRQLVIKSVTKGEGHVDILFFETCLLLRLRKQWLIEREVDPATLVAGRHVLVQGKEGSDDIHLSLPDGFEDLKVLPALESEKAVAKAQLDFASFLELQKALNQSELFGFTTVISKPAKIGNFLKITLVSEEVAGFLLISSLYNGGVLEKWGRYFKLME